MRHFVLLIMLATPAGWAQSANPQSVSQAQQQRIQQLSDAMLAPCCWAESVAVHRSEIAAQIRAEIRRFVGEGKSDREILDHYKGIHGARILREPEGNARVLVYLVPTVATVVGLAVLLLVIRMLLRPIQTDLPTHH